MTEQTAFTPDDFWLMRFVTDMRLSPDGSLLAYAVQSNDRAANETRSAIWLWSPASGQARQLTSGARRDTNPRWSPDGHLLAFESDRAGGKTQVWVVPVDGGEARQVSHLRRGASDPVWTADGAALIVRGEVRPEENPLEPLSDEPAERARRKKDEADRPRIVTRLQYRWDGKGYFEGRTHLFRVPLNGGAVEQLTDGDYDHGDAACSPDGRVLAFVSDRDEDRDANMTNDVWLLDLATRELRRLTDGGLRVHHLVWSPDGTRLAYLGDVKIGAHGVHNVQLLVADVAGGGVANLLEGRDLSAANGLYNDVPSPATSAPAWAPDGRSLLFVSQRGGASAVLQAPVAGAAVTTVVEASAHDIQQFAASPDGSRFYVLRTDPQQPWDIWEVAAGGQPDAAPARRCSDVNAALSAAHVAVAPERFRFASFDGTEIEAWLYRPARAASTPAPLVLWIHGGPATGYGQAFYLQAQIMAGRGYAVLYANPRGSTGYGQAFAQACERDWGGGDYRDLMVAVDAALARGGLDAERLAVMGTSYGGYMTNWIIGQTGRFKAAVTINSVTNLLSSFGTGDIDSVWAQGDYGWPWENEQYYRERSPLTHAGKVTTPLRIIAAEHDYRCPISQSEELFVWLKKLGRAPVDFVRLPNASHGIFASPRQRIRRMELVLEWIQQWCPA
jgi:dipeptidyl aminopeptidase/acylaminoacyl peptidase